MQSDINWSYTVQTEHNILNAGITINIITVTWTTNNNLRTQNICYYKHEGWTVKYWLPSNQEKRQ